MKSSDYDSIFFESLPNPERHIDRLYSQLRLKGVMSAPPSRAQVLEIGCSTGFNLIPQALLYPESQFLGVDLSEAQIAEARKTASALNLINITFEAVGIENLKHTSKSFDYIICHGLYSWVAPAVQSVLLDRISYFLALQGVAYLSYNTASGWKGNASIKQLFTDVGIGSLGPREKITKIRGLICYALAKCRETSVLSQSRTCQFFTYLDTASDALLLHEYLNPHASGISVAELHCSLDRYNLQYFGDARPQRDSTHRNASNIYPDYLVAGLLRAEWEDLNDVFRPKSFRSALIVHQSINEQPITTGAQIIDLYYASPLIEVSQGINEDGFLFMLGEEQPCQVSDRVIVTIIKKLIESWPTPVAGQLLELDRLSNAQLNSFMALICTGAIQVSFGTFACAHQIAEKPHTSSFLRLRASVSSTLVTLKHEHFQANIFERGLISLLNGNSDQQRLSLAMYQLYEAGQLAFIGDQEADVNEEFFVAAVEMALKEFLEHGLLLE